MTGVQTCALPISKTFDSKRLNGTPTVFLDGTQLNLQAVATATALTEAVAKLPAAAQTPAGGDAGAPTGGDAGAPTPSPESAG